MLTLTTLALDLLLGRQHRVASPDPAQRRRRPAVKRQEPLLCFEVLVPYVDPAEARRKRLPLDARHSTIVRVWAPDAHGATECALELFADLRLRRRGTPRLAEGGPVVLRIVQADKRAA